EGLEKVLNYFKDKENITEIMVYRAGLPINIAEKLVTLVSGAMKAYLMERHPISSEVVERVTQEAREEATLGLLSKKQKEEALSDEPKKNDTPPGQYNANARRYVEQLVRHLHSRGKLSHSLLLRALCEGNLAFFEAGI